MKPELLAPAGNLEKARIAFAYGADAVFVGGAVFGLRKYADNFSLTELKILINEARTQKKSVYVVLNAFAHNSDINAVQVYINELNAIKPDAVIVSDLGVADYIQKHSSLNLHISTQASIAHATSCEVWKTLGAKRAILARETSVEECIKIKEKCDIELETFIHGAMCASYSGKCVISNYAAGRDSNRGGCVQSCRHKYTLFDPKNEISPQSTHVMNAKDLMGIDIIPQIIDAKIESLKIEGRMKSNLYVANAVSVYRSAIDYCYEQKQKNLPISQEKLNSFKSQLAMVSNRSFSHGGLKNKLDGDSINYAFSQYNKSIQYIGMIRSFDTKNNAICDVKTTFNSSDTLFYLSPEQSLCKLDIHNVTDMQGNDLKQTKPNSLIRIALNNEKKLNSLDILVRKLPENLS